MNPNQRAWTYNDEWILRNEYPKKPTVEVAKMLRRSVYAVNMKASSLGLKKQHHGIVWDERELRMLREYFPMMLNDNVAKLIGVSQRTMSRKAAELGLTKAEDFRERNRMAISDRASASLKRVANVRTRFRKGEHANPDGEFRPGQRMTPEQKEKQSASLKESWRQRKILKRYGLI